MARRLLPDSLSLANIVASSYNFDELPALVRYFYAMGVYTYITPVMIATEENGDYRFRAMRFNRNAAGKSTSGPTVSSPTRHSEPPPPSRAP